MRRYLTKLDPFELQRRLSVTSDLSDPSRSVTQADGDVDQNDADDLDAL